METVAWSLFDARSNVIEQFHEIGGAKGVPAFHLRNRQGSPKDVRDLRRRLDGGLIPYTKLPRRVVV